MLKSDYKIFTKHLDIRCFSTNDYDDMMELRSNPANNPFAPDDLWRTIDDAKEFFNFTALFYDDNPNQPSWFRYFFAIREHNNEKVIGFCGIGAPDFDRGLSEVFYSLSHSKWNNGYATEAAKAMLEFGFNKVGLERIIGFINPENVASGRVLEKAGLRKIGVLDNIPKDHDFFGNTLFEISRNDYFI